MVHLSTNMTLVACDPGDTLDREAPCDSLSRLVQICFLGLGLCLFTLSLLTCQYSYVNIKLLKVQETLEL